MCVNLSTLPVSRIDLMRKYSMNKRYFMYHTLVSYVHSRAFFPPPSDECFASRSGNERANVLAGLAFFCAHAGCTSPWPGQRASPPLVRSRQASTVAQEENEKGVRLNVLLLYIYVPPNHLTEASASGRWWMEYVPEHVQLLVPARRPLPLIS